MATYARRGRHSECRDVWQRLAERYSTTTNAVPQEAYRCLVHAYAVSDQYLEAFETALAMRREHGELSDSLRRMLAEEISGSAARVESALEALGQLAQKYSGKSVPPELVDVAFRACAHGRQSKLALQFIQRLGLDYNVPVGPDEITQFLSVCVAAGDYESAVAVVRAVVQAVDMAVPVRVWEQLIETSQRANCPAACLQLLGQATELGAEVPSEYIEYLRDMVRSRRNQ